MSRPRGRSPQWLALALALGLTTSGCQTVGKTLDAAPPGPSTTTIEVPSTSTSTTSAPPRPVPAWEPLGEPGAGGHVVDLAFNPKDASQVLVAGDLTGIGFSADGGATWQVSSGLANPEIGRLTFHPTRDGEIWAGTMGGPHLSTDGGKTWSVRRVGMPEPQPESYSAPIDEILVDPRDPNHLIALGGSHREWSPNALGNPAWGAVWSSTDAGTNWARVATVAGGANLVDGEWLPDGTLLIAALHKGLLRSTDGGTTWQDSSAGLPHGEVRAIAVHPTDPARIWVSLGSVDSGSGPKPGGVWRSVDGGRTWALASTGLPQAVGFDGTVTHTSRYHALRISLSNPEVLVTGNQAWGNEALFRTSDGGNTWVEILGQQSFRRPPTAYGTPISAEAIAIDPQAPSHLLVGNAEFVLRTRDGGRSWEDITSDLTEDGTYSGNGYSGLVANRVGFNADGTSVVLCGFDGANPLLSTNGGTSWRRPVRSWDNWGGCIDVASSGSQWWALLGQGRLFNGIARFGGNDSAAQVAAGIAAGLPERGVELSSLGGVVASVGPDGGTVVLATLDGALFRSVNGGASFTRSQPAPAAGRLSTDPANPAIVYLAAADGLWRSADAGTSFRLIEGSPRNVERITVAGPRLYATVWRKDGAGLWVSELGGPWQQLVNEPTAFELAVDPIDPNHLLLASNDHPYHDVIRSVGVLRSIDGGLTWEPYNPGLPLPRVAAVAFDPARPGRVVIGTFGRGFFDLTFTDR